MNNKDLTIHEGTQLGQELKSRANIEALYLVHEGKDIPVTAQVSIGRSKKNNIVIEDELVSRRHVLIQKKKAAYFIKDLKSTNGTLLNNKPVPPGEFHPLYEDDVIKIGSTELIIKSFF
jgi:pSer/pThr/pTyr-binding forkhead associated (FHA) protein